MAQTLGTTSLLTFTQAISSFNLVDVNATLFFTARTNATGVELWRSDGTVEGTKLVKDIAPGPKGSLPDVLTNVNGTLYFSADDGNTGRELWRSDGTAAGTTLVRNLTRDLEPGGGSSIIQTIAAMDGIAYFVAVQRNTDTNGPSLWRSDGSAAGTLRIKALQSPGAELIALDSTLLFFDGLYNGIRSGTLWSTDGTFAGTRRISPYLNNVILGPTIEGGLFFAANDYQHGRELWFTNGSAADTEIIYDLTSDCASSDPQSLTVSGALLFFSANNGQSDRELWATPADASLYTRYHSYLSVLANQAPRPTPTRFVRATPTATVFVATVAPTEEVMQVFEQTPVPTPIIPPFGEYPGPCF